MKVPKTFHKKKAAIAMAQKTKQRIDKWRLNPKIRSEVLDPGFEIPDMIRVVEYDERLKHDLCKDAIAFSDKYKGVPVLTLLRRYAGELDLCFKKGAEDTVYYVNPVDRKEYICLDEYFDYLKTEKVTELDRIARNLGAKRVKIVVKEEKKIFARKEAGGKSKGKKAFGGKMGVHAGHEKKKTEFKDVAVELDAEYAGSDTPQKPALKYYADDTDVLNMIEARMDEKNQLLSKMLLLKYNTSSLIKTELAVKIDAALKAMDLGGNFSIRNEVETENLRYLSYEIRF